MFVYVLSVVLLVAVIAVTVLGERDKKRKRQAFHTRYPTFEHFRAAVDADAIRAVRARSGEIHAIRAVRAAHPGLSLVDAKRYVDELD